MDGEMISKAIEPLDQFAARAPSRTESPFVLVQPSRRTLATCRESEQVSDQECQLCVNNPHFSGGSEELREEFECGLADQRSAESEPSQSWFSPLTFLDEQVGCAKT